MYFSFLFHVYIMRSEQWIGTRLLCCIGFQQLLPASTPKLTWRFTLYLLMVLLQQFQLEMYIPTSWWGDGPDLQHGNTFCTPKSSFRKEKKKPKFRTEMAWKLGFFYWWKEHTPFHRVSSIQRKHGRCSEQCQPARPYRINCRNLIDKRTSRSTR